MVPKGGVLVGNITSASKYLSVFLSIKRLLNRYFKRQCDVTDGLVTHYFMPKASYCALCAVIYTSVTFVRKLSDGLFALCNAIKN